LFVDELVDEDVTVVRPGVVDVAEESESESESYPFPDSDFP
jgi:hypothetical protein